MPKTVSICRPPGPSFARRRQILDVDGPGRDVAAALPDPFEDLLARKGVIPALDL